MKKNLFYAAFALAMMASCTNEDNLVVDPVEPTPEDKVAIELGIDAPTVNATVGARSTGSVGGTGEKGNDSEANNWNGQKLYITMVNKGTNTVTPISDTDANPLLGYDSYTYNAPTTGETGLIQIKGTNNGTDETKHVYYPTQGRFDFYGWHVDDIEATPNSENPLLIENIKITGQQDIMGARTKEFTAENYNTKNETETHVEDFTLMQGWDFSARTARNGIKPILAFEHQLARLKFFVRAGSEKTIGDEDWPSDRTDKNGNAVSSNAMQVTAITVKNMYDDLTMNLNSNGAIETTTTDTEATAEFKLLSRNEEGSTDKGQMKTTLDPVAPTAVYNAENESTKGVQVGESVMFFPWGDSKTTIDLDIELQQYVQIWGDEDDEFTAANWDYMTQKAPLKVHASSVVVDGNTKATEFEARKSYNVYITIYGFERIEVSAELTPWEMGGDVDVDVEEGQSKHNVDVAFNVTGLDDGVTPSITVKQHKGKDCTTDTEVTAQNGKYNVESFSTLHYTIKAAGYVTVTGVANAENGKTISITMKASEATGGDDTTGGENADGDTTGGDDTTGGETTGGENAGGETTGGETTTS